MSGSRTGRVVAKALRIRAIPWISGGIALIALLGHCENGSATVLPEQRGTRPVMTENAKKAVFWVVLGGVVTVIWFDSAWISLW